MGDSWASLQEALQSGAAMCFGFWTLSAAATGSLANLGRAGMSSTFYERVAQAPTTLEERRRVQRVFCALENTLYSTARDYNSSHANSIDLFSEIFQQPVYHSTFAFYYKHPIYRSDSCFAISIGVCQLALFVYLWLPFVNATDAMQLSNQARLIRHSAHRHILVGLVVFIFISYVVYSGLSCAGSKSLVDEGVVCAVTLLVHVIFGGLG